MPSKASHGRRKQQQRLDCYDNLVGSLEYAWMLLERGVTDRHSPMHTLRSPRSTGTDAPRFVRSSFEGVTANQDSCGFTPTDERRRSNTCWRTHALRFTLTTR